MKINRNLFTCWTSKLFGTSAKTFYNWSNTKIWQITSWHSIKLFYSLICFSTLNVNPIEQNQVNWILIQFSLSTKYFCYVREYLSSIVSLGMLFIKKSLVNDRDNHEITLFGGQALHASNKIQTKCHILTWMSMMNKYREIFRWNTYISPNEFLFCMNLFEKVQIATTCRFMHY